MELEARAELERARGAAGESGGVDVVGGVVKDAVRGLQLQDCRRVRGADGEVMKRRAVSGETAKERLAAGPELGADPQSAAAARGRALVFTMSCVVGVAGASPNLVAAPPMNGSPISKCSR